MNIKKAAEALRKIASCGCQVPWLRPCPGCTACIASEALAEDEPDTPDTGETIEYPVHHEAMQLLAEIGGLDQPTLEGLGQFQAANYAREAQRIVDEYNEACVAQSEEHGVSTSKAAGSSPAARTTHEALHLTAEMIQASHDYAISLLRDEGGDFFELQAEHLNVELAKARPGANELDCMEASAALIDAIESRLRDRRTLRDSGPVLRCLQMIDRHRSAAKARNGGA